MSLFEEGVVVDQSDTHVQVWTNRLSTVVPVKHWRMRGTWEIGTSVRISMTENGEAKSLEKIPSWGVVIVNGKDLKILVRLIFPPKELLPKIGLKLYSATVGLISVDYSWKFLFDQAAHMDPAVYEATAEWCRSSNEFVLAANQQLMSTADHFPTYLSLLIQSPWAENIETPQRAQEILQYVMEELDPTSRSSSDSSSSDDESNAFMRTAILMEVDRTDREDLWSIYVLDQEEMKLKWAVITGDLMSRHSHTPYRGALIEIDVDFKGVVESWRVVDCDESLQITILTDYRIDGKEEEKVMLDVAARVEKEVTIGNRKIIKLYNKRIMEVYDYHNILRDVDTGEVVRVIVKWSRIETDILDKRFEWIVHDYGKGVEVLPETNKEIRKRKERERAFNEFRLVEYATEHDWTDNDVLWNYCREYKRVMVESAAEEVRREEEREAEARRKEEEEFIRHKLQLDAEEDEEDDGLDELARLKLQSPLDSTLQSPGNSTFIRHKQQSDSEEKDEERIMRPQLESSLDSTLRSESPCNSTQSSAHTTTTVIRRPLPAFGHNLSGTIARPPGESRLPTAQTTVSARQGRLISLGRRLEHIVGLNELIRSQLNLQDAGIISALNFALNDYSF